MSKIDLQAAMGAAALIEKTVAALKAKRAKLASSRDELQLKVQALHRAALPREDVLALMMKSIDEAGREFPALANWDAIFKAYARPKGARPPNNGPVEIGTGVAGAHGGEISLQDLLAIGSGGRRAIDRLIGLDGGSFFTGAGEHTEHFESARAYFFFGDVIKTAVAHHFERLFPIIDAGVSAEIKAMSVAQRQQQIDDYEGEIQAKDAEIAEVDEQLKAVAPAKR